MMETHEHPLSWEALSRIVLMGTGLLLIWKALGAVVVVIVALVLTFSLQPLVHKLHEKSHMPVMLCAFMVFGALLIPFIALGFLAAPNITTQLPQLYASIDTTLNHLPYVGHVFDNFSIVQYVSSHSSDLIASSGTILFTIFSVVSTVVLAFYFVYDYDRLLRLFLGIFPYKEKDKLKGFIGEISRVTGQYIRGNVIISCITFVVIFIGLTACGIPFALPLALFAGIVDLLPLVGSTLGAIPALLVAFSLSPLQGFLVLIIHLVYQQVENAFISPAIYNKALNLYPALGFLAVLIGAGLFGMLGAFLALPVAASITVIVLYHENYRQRHQNGAQLKS